MTDNSVYRMVEFVCSEFLLVSQLNVRLEKSLFSNLVLSDFIMFLLQFKLCDSYCKLLRCRLKVRDESLNLSRFVHSLSLVRVRLCLMALVYVEIGITGQSLD